MTTREADRLFSKLILERDKVCQRCGARSGLTCSHYWNRWRALVRFDPENCIALCVRCHAFWELEPCREYDEFMLRRLGPVTMESLESRARSIMKMRAAVEAFAANRGKENGHKIPESSG